MKMVFAFLLLCSATQAGMLSQFTVPSSSSRIVFGVVPVGGVGPVFIMNNSVENFEYRVSTQDVDFMSQMFNDPTSYTHHGPLRVTANSWVANYSALTYSHTDMGLGGQQTCCAVIVGSPSILSTRWTDVVLVRTGSVLAVNILAVPEPDYGLIIAVLIMILATHRTKGK